jgi:outer membrane protein
MKKVFLTALVFLFAIGLFAKPIFAAEIKIGYLDVAKVFDEYKKTKEQDATLEAQAKLKQGERDKLVSEITRFRDELELLSEKGKQDKQSVIDEKVKKLQEYDTVTRNDLRKKRDDMVADILKEIDAVVQDYGKKQGYDIILNDKVIVYKKDNLDVTADILKTLNSQYQPGAAAAKTQK